MTINPLETPASNAATTLDAAIASQLAEIMRQPWPASDHTSQPISKQADTGMPAGRPGDHLVNSGILPSVELHDGQGHKKIDSVSSDRHQEHKSTHGNAHKDTPLEAEHKKLTDLAAKILPKAERSVIAADMNIFEHRARTAGLSEQEVLKTYEQIERLLRASGDKPLTAKERLKIAEAVLFHAAMPTNIDQGSHNTCSVTALECRIFTRTPSEAARLIADVALTGQYTAHDGTVIKVDPTPHDQSKEAPYQDCIRTHASEIFQVTAVNLYYAARNKQTGKDIRYVQTEPVVGNPEDTGERLYDYSSGKAKLVMNDGNPAREPNMGPFAAAETSNLITGKNETDVALRAGASDKNGLISDVSSVRSLQKKLLELKAEHKLPIITMVHSDNEPFYTDCGGGAAGGSGAWHVVTITDYDEKTGKVYVDNEWGYEADHDRDRPINVSDLFVAMNEPKKAEALIAWQINDEKKHGQVSTNKELDLLRTQLECGDCTQQQAKYKLQELVRDLSTNGASGLISKEEEKAEWHKARAMINTMPTDIQLYLFKSAHLVGEINDDVYKSELVDIGIGYMQAHTPADQPAISDPAAIRRTLETVPGFKKLFSEMSPADITNLINRIKPIGKFF
jgi:hypothetical protein